MNENAATIAQTIDAARRAQRRWRDVPVGERLRAVGRLRRLIVEHADELITSVELPGRTGEAETLAAEIIPLADACRFLQQRARRILAPRRLGRRGRPAWLWGLDSQVRREPFGVVLIIAPWNYPLLLAGVQAIQALTAGNAVLLKPGRGSSRAAEALARLIHLSRIDPALCAVLDESVEAAQAAIDPRRFEQRPPSSDSPGPENEQPAARCSAIMGVDKVVLTGSAATGQAVLAQLSETLTPAVMELSGCDAVIVRADADPAHVARAIHFGLRINSGATCISPRRIIVHRDVRLQLERELSKPLVHQPPLHVDPAAEQVARPVIASAIRDGARTVVGEFRQDRVDWPLILADVSTDMELLRSDVFVPVAAVLEVEDDRAALAAVRACPYGLGASVFSRDRRAAQRLAEQVPAGSVAVNDLIVPTVDPRLPFGGWGRSGFGSTRAAEGLIEMTRPKAIAVRTSNWLPHLDQFQSAQSAAGVPASHADGTVHTDASVYNQRQTQLASMLRAYLALAHGGSLLRRWRAIGDLARAMMGFRRAQRRVPTTTREDD